MKINEGNYIEELRRKNPRALDYIIDEYGSVIKGITVKVLSVLGDEGLVEECIADVFLLIWQNSYKYDEKKGSFKSWIGAITKFKAIDYYRKYSKSIHKDIIEDDLSTGLGTEEIYISKIETEGLISIIEGLDEPDRTIFTMKYLLGETTKKISEVVKLSISAVNTRISRGREKIKKSYYKEVGGDC